MGVQDKPRESFSVHDIVQRQVGADDFMRTRINSEMPFSPDTTALFAVLFDFPLTSTEDFEPCGINKALRSSQGQAEYTFNDQDGGVAG